MTVWNPHSDGRPVILHVVDKLCGGGTERMLVALLNRLNPHHLRHVVVTMRDAGPGAASLPDHVACHALGIEGASRWGWLRLAKVARTWNASVVHARNTGCWCDAAAASLITPGAIAVLGFHGVDRLDSVDGHLPPRVRWLTRLGALYASVSHDGARRLHGTLGVPDDRITVLPNGVDVERFVPAESANRSRLRARLGLPQNATLLGTVGSLTPIKRFDLAIDGFAALREPGSKTHLVVVGDGPLYDSLTRHATGKGLEDRVHLLGPSEDIPDVLASLDGYLCCSDFEGVNNALLEAMACGLPVITTRVGDHASIVRDRREGLVIDAGDVQGLAAALARLCRDEPARRSMGTAARARAKEFAIDAAVRRYESFYDRLAARELSVTPSIKGSDSPAPPLWPQAV